MKIQHKLTLDLQQRTNPPVLHLKQGDCMTRELLLTLTNDGTVWTPPDEAVIYQIAYCKMDRSGGCYDALHDGTPACTSEGDQLLVQLHPQMLTVSGFVICELRMLNDLGARLSTFSFFLDIEPTAISGVKSADYYRFTSLEQLRNEIGNLSTLQTEDKSSIVAALNEMFGQTKRLPASGGNADTVNGKTAEEIQQEAVLSAMKSMVLMLENAKESGEFDGEKGDKGDDYVLTEADKAEIAAQAANTATTAATEAATTAATEAATTAATAAAVTQVAQEQAQFAAGIDLGTPVKKKMLTADGTIKDIGNSYMWIVETPVIPGAPYHIRACACYTYCFYAIADANGAVIAKERAEEADFNTYSQIEKTLIMPANAATMRIAYYTDGFEAGYIRYGYPNIGSRFAGKKWTALGDSLTAESDRTDILYHGYIAAELGLVVTNKGQGGTGFKNRDDENVAFYQRAQGISTDADIVTIMGGANDVNLTTVEIGNVTDTGTDTICGCINTTLDNVINLFLNAGKVPKIGVITSPPTQTQLPSIPDCRLAQISDAVIEICRLRSIPCLDLFRKSNLHPDLEAFRNLVYTKDVKEDGTLEGVHPNEIGHRMMASIIRPFIETLL